MNWAKIIALLAISVVANAQTQPPPQTARQALLEMVFSKSPKSFEKHIPETALEIFGKTDSGLTPALLSQISGIQSQLTMGGKHLETFETGPFLVVSESSQDNHQERVEIAVDRDDLSGDEDQIELSMHVYKDGVIDRMPVVPSLIVDMKEEKDIWRLSQITVAIHVPLSDPDYIKGIAEDMRKTRQRVAEYQAISALQSLGTAQIARQKNSSGALACNLSELGEAGKFVTYGSMSERANEQKKDYVFKIADCSGSSFHITAEPEKGGPARRALCIDETGVARFADDGKSSTCISSGRSVHEMETEGGSHLVVGSGRVD